MRNSKTCKFVIGFLLLLMNASCDIGDGLKSATTRKPLPKEIADRGLQGTQGTAGVESADEDLVQVERVARPLVKLGLIQSSEALSSFNSIAPSEDLGSAGSLLRDDVLASFGLIASLAPGGPSAEEIAREFLPDVVRIKVDEPVSGAIGYTSCVNSAGTGPFYCGGRKIRDDVVDITFSFIATGQAPRPYPVSDGVEYSMAHRAPLRAFPFLARPH